MSNPTGDSLADALRKENDLLRRRFVDATRPHEPMTLHEAMAHCERMAGPPSPAATITDEHRARSVSADFILCGPDGKDIQIWFDGHVVGWEGTVINRFPVVRAQIEQDAARRCTEIAFKIGKPVGGADGGTYVPGTSSDVWRAICAEFKIKD